MSCDTGPYIWFSTLNHSNMKNCSRTNCGLAGLDLALGNNSLLGGHCSTGIGCLEKL